MSSCQQPKSCSIRPIFLPNTRLSTPRFFKTNSFDNALEPLRIEKVAILLSAPCSLNTYPNLVLSDAHPNFLLDTRSDPYAGVRAMIVPFTKTPENCFSGGNSERFAATHCFESVWGDVFLTYAFLFLHYEKCLNLIHYEMKTRL